MSICSVNYMKNSAYALVLVGVLALSGCSSLGAQSQQETPSPTTTDVAEGQCSGVSIVVDFGALDSPTISECVDTTTTIAAADALTAAGVATVGTTEWGDQIVCRVNDRPAVDEALTVEGHSSYTESCASMPAAFAYWALWVKPSPDADWEYASEGVGTLQSEPGQSLGLVFTTGTETPTPGS